VNLAVDPIVQSNVPAAVAAAYNDTISAVHTRAGCHGDYCDDGANDLPGLVSGSIPITQDEVVPPDVLDKVSHQVSRIAEARVTDEMCDSTTGHAWKSGVLMLEVKWTNYTVTIPASLQSLCLLTRLILVARATLAGDILVGHASSNGHTSW
jgi:hypothetical protein